MLKQLIITIMLTSVLGVSAAPAHASCTEKYRAALESVGREQNLNLNEGIEAYNDYLKKLPTSAVEIAPLSVELTGGALGAAGLFAFGGPVAWGVVAAGAIIEAVGVIESFFEDDGAKDEITQAQADFKIKSDAILADLKTTISPYNQLEEMYGWTSAITNKNLSLFEKFLNSLPGSLSSDPNRLAHLGSQLEDANNQELFCPGTNLMTVRDFKLLMIGFSTGGKKTGAPEERGIRLK